MLYVESENGNFTWHIGQEISRRTRNEIVDANRLLVQADCNELEWIRENITGIPFNKNRVQTWKGDLASFIAYSLPSHSFAHT